MTDQDKIQGTSATSFSDAAQNAAKQISELPDEEQVTFNLTQASVVVGGLKGETEYKVTLERADA